jgi:Protein of unknown function (DUF3365)
MVWPSTLWLHKARVIIYILAATVMLPTSLLVASPTAEDETTAQNLAAMLRAGWTVISQEQNRINDPEIGDKELSGAAVLERARNIYQANTGVDPDSIDPASQSGRLLRDQMDAIVEVMDANQTTINAKGTGFKGFIPALFARLVNEAFVRRANGEAEMKLTAPSERVRNLKARPDAWEEEIIETRLLSPNWPRGQPYSAAVEFKGRPAFRVMVPEYYDSSCLSCHGSPKGELDITGYPKEGAKEGELGGIISIVLHH